MTRLAAATWPEVEAYLKKSDVLLLPIGSTEQHGPTGLLGTDHLTADAIAREVATRTGALVAPPVCYGMASHHMAFAGSVTLRPSVYQAMMAEILRSYYHHGFRKFHVVNGHGGNEPSMRAVFQELKHEGLEGASFHFYNWWKLPEVARLADELYGEREGFHATPSEVSLTFFLEGIESRPYDFKARSDIDEKGFNWPVTAVECRKIFPDGAMKSDPGLARRAHGELFLKAAVESIAASVKERR
ncbi:MAG: creatininase family protein [Deltaproteobacteria bacterium]|nr:creatininase family protein [Deltaproteobacteria bacterium]